MSTDNIFSPDDALLDQLTESDISMTSTIISDFAIDNSNSFYNGNAHLLTETSLSSSIHLLLLSETTVLGERVSSPICVAPTAMQRMAHNDGECATSKAAAR